MSEERESSISSPKSLSENSKKEISSGFKTVNLGDYFPKICFAYTYPDLTTQHHRWVQDCIDRTYEKLRQQNWSIYEAFGRGSQTDDNRNDCVRVFLETDYQYLFFVDADTTFMPEWVEMLVDDDKDIVSGLFVTRHDPQKPIRPVVHGLRWQEGKPAWYQAFEERRLNSKDYLQQVAGTGMAFTLIKRGVFEKMPSPWFTYERNKLTKEYLRHDLGFCCNARSHGFLTWVDYRITCGHIGEKEWTIWDYLIMKEQGIVK